MIINNFDTDKKVLVIAEIGNNHEGNFNLAEKMIGLAAQSGAGAVKFQTIIPDKLISCTQADRIKQLKKFQLTYNDFEKLSRIAEKEKVLFLSTPFDIESACFLNQIVPAFKIASGDNLFFPLLEKIAQFDKPIILSSGMTTLKQLNKIKYFIESIWEDLDINQQLAILHCVSSYPVPPEEANLSAIGILKKQLKTDIGYSDHTIGIDAAILSVAIGARIIEKHFTIDKNYSGFRDHQLSADPEEMSLLVKKIEHTEMLIGNGKKKIQTAEKDLIINSRRSIVAKKDLPAGTIVKWDDITWVRPANGISPGNEFLILGKQLTKNVKIGEPLIPEYF